MHVNGFIVWVRCVYQETTATCEPLIGGLISSVFQTFDDFRKVLLIMYLYTPRQADPLVDQKQRQTINAYIRLYPNRSSMFRLKGLAIQMIHTPLLSFPQQSQTQRAMHNCS